MLDSGISGSASMMVDGGVVIADAGTILSVESGDLDDAVVEKDGVVGTSSAKLSECTGRWI